jgi:hypothetical protein
VSAEDRIGSTTATDAEEGIIACLFREVELILSTDISSDLFTDGFFRTVYTTMLRLARAGEEVDVLTVATAMTRGDPAKIQRLSVRLNSICGNIDTTAHYRKWLASVEAAFKLRRVRPNVEKAYRGLNSNDHTPEAKLATVAREVESLTKILSNTSDGLNGSTCAETFYYDGQRRDYLMQNTDTDWMRLTVGDVKRHLRHQGFPGRAEEGETLSAADRELIRIQMDASIAYAGPLAGHGHGLYEVEGRKILVTESPRKIVPAPGSWDTLRGILENMFRADDIKEPQTTFLYGWLQVALTSFLSGNTCPGQALVLAGVHDCGKSLLQNLVTEFLGGRSAKPFSHMTGETDFNSELFRAEHQIVEDEAASTNIRSRRRFGAALKNMTVNETQRCHRKNAEPLTLRPFWRVSISVNDEPENLMVLPPIDDSLSDKLILLKTARPPKPFPTDSLDARREFWETLKGELPHLAYYLNYEFEIPEHLKSARFGITHFHHPDILAAIDAMAPETRLLQLIDTELFKGSIVIWTGSAADLERVLTGEDCNSRYEARKLLSWNNATGTYLGRLAVKHSDRFIYHRTEKRREWEIRQFRS